MVKITLGIEGMACGMWLQKQGMLKINQKRKLQRSAGKSEKRLRLKKWGL